MHQRSSAHHYPHHYQLGPHGLRFGQTWSMPIRNHPTDAYSNGSYTNNNEHWCETCDRGFRTSDLLVNHKQQHQKCNIDGCQFIAHPKVITKHIQMQHSTGLYEKIARLNDPEEIEKWKEERRKRYPTKENIDKKCAEIKEKIERGEKMGMKHQTGNRPNKTEHAMKRKYIHDTNRLNLKRRFQQQQLCSAEVKKPVIIKKKHDIFPKRENKIVPQVNETRTLKPFTGILNLIDDSEDDNIKDIETNVPIEDDDYILMNEHVEQSKAVIIEPVVCEALSSLINNYESSDEESNNKIVQMKNENLTINKSINFNDHAKQSVVMANLQNRHTTYRHTEPLSAVDKSDDDSGPEEAKIVKNVEEDNNSNVPSTFRKGPSNKECSRKTELQKRSNDTKNQNKFRPKLPSTLLEKLLHREIRRERNIILQCIRHIVKNNYFEKTGNK